MNRVCLIMAAAISLAGCATDSGPYGTSPAPVGEATQPVQQAHRYGYVESIETVSGDRRASPGVGAIGGAIAGGVLGNQVGHGTGRAAATVGGAVIGGVVGHEVEQRVRGNEASTEYAYRVRMDDSSFQTFRRPTQDIRVGDRVRIEGGAIYPM